jgi:hypothetical protein
MSRRGMVVRRAHGYRVPSSSLRPGVEATMTRVVSVWKAEDTLVSEEGTS